MTGGPGEGLEALEKDWKLRRRTGRSGEGLEALEKDWKLWRRTESSGEEQSLRNLLSVRLGRGESFPVLLDNVQTF